MIIFRFIHIAKSCPDTSNELSSCWFFKSAVQSWVMTVLSWVMTMLKSKIEFFIKNGKSNLLNDDRNPHFYWSQVNPNHRKKFLSTIIKIQISKKQKEAERFITSVITIVITGGHKSRKFFEAISWCPDCHDWWRICHDHDDMQTCIFLGASNGSICIKCISNSSFSLWGFKYNQE